MQNSNNSRVLGVLLVVPASLLVGLWVMTNPTGAISGLSKLITIFIALVTLISPKKGLFFIIPQILYTDEIKRLAVAYGAVSYSTVYEVLLGPIISLSLLNVGYLAGVALGRNKLSRQWIYAMLLIGAISLAVFASETGGIPKRGQAALNIGLYLTIIPMMGVLIQDPDEARKVMKAQIWWAVPSILWGIQQYYFGFNSIEWQYARTGLSPTHSAQMLGMSDPRPFGLFGSATGYSCIGIYAALALLYTFKNHRFNFGYALIFAISLWAIYGYKGRGLILVVPIIFLTAFCFKSRLRTWLYYLLGGGTLLGGIAFSERILYGGGIDWANQFIAVNTPWGRDVLTFNTFSDRLKGWAMLTKASTYSAFGNLFKKADEIRIISYKDTDYRHDILTSIVINTGVVGLGVFLAIVVTVLVKAHGPLLAIKNSATRWEASVALACAFTVSALSVTTGNVFSTTPINFQIWTAVGTFLVLSQSAREEAQEEETREPTSAPWRQARLPARNAPRLA